LRKPASLSEIAAEVGVSKSTASYHMKELVERGIAEITDVKSVKGGVYTKTFALRPGTVVVSEPHAVAGGVGRSLVEHYESLKMNWTTDPRSENITIFLYQVLLSLSGVAREGVESALLHYGRLFGEEVLSPSVKSRGLARELREMVGWLERTSSATCSVANGDGGTKVITCPSFFRASEFDSPVFKFLQGIIEGFLALRHGKRYLLEARSTRAGPPEIMIRRRRGFS